jgi:hypothetical protein
MVHHSIEFLKCMIPKVEQTGLAVYTELFVQYSMHDLRLVRHTAKDPCTKRRSCILQYGRPGKQHVKPRALRTVRYYWWKGIELPRSLQEFAGVT